MFKRDQSVSTVPKTCQRPYFPWCPKYVALVCLGFAKLCNTHVGRVLKLCFLLCFTKPMLHTPNILAACCWVSIVLPPLPMWLPHSRSYQSVAIYRVPALPKWGSLPSKLPKCRYLPCSCPCPGGVPRPRTCSHPCPSGVPRPRSFQSVAIYRVPAPAQVGFPALKVTQVSLFIVFPPLPK